MKMLPALVAIVIVLVLPGTVLAQGAAPNAAVAQKIAEARATNAVLMQQYSWTSRTEVIDQGQVKDIRIDAVNYGPGGQLQRTVMNDRSAPLPIGCLRRRIAEAERQRVEQYLSGLRDLLEQYTLPTAGRVQDFMNRATATGPDAAGLFEVTGQNVAYPGDTFSIWVNPVARHSQKIQVST